jgi:hypothetical protein
MDPVAKRGPGGESMRNALSRLTNQVVTLTLLAFAVPSVCVADISLIIEEAVGGAGEFTGSGHAAIYFSNICAETPIQLRLCRTGEEGVVISTYPEYGTRTPYKWIAVPLTAFLLGVDNEKDAPVYINGEIRKFIREQYRRSHPALRAIVPDAPDNSVPAGRWTEMLGSNYNRDIFLLTVKTTPEQDTKFLRDFAKVPNVNDFDNVYNNCADFVRETFNKMYPHATHRDIINDLTMTTPKALANSLIQYASARPELMFSITRYPQVHGCIRRSLNNRNMTEKAMISKKYFLTMWFTKPPMLYAFDAAYLLGGWMVLDKQYRKFAGDDIAELNYQAKLLKTGKATVARGKRPSLAMMLVDDIEPAAVPTLTKKDIEREKDLYRNRLFGTEDQWKKYQAEFKPILSQAIEAGLFIDTEEVKTFFKDLEIEGEPALDGNGGLVLNVNDRGRNEVVGLTKSNILSSASNKRLAYKILLGKVNYELNAPGRNRSSMPEFQQWWAMMKQLSNPALRDELVAQNRANAPRFRQHEEVVSNSKRAQKLLMQITH